MKKPKHAGFDAPFLDAEEELLVRDAEAGHYVSSADADSRIREFKAAARNTLRKKPITVRVQERDIERIKVMALEQGIPYQTLVASILHRYATGALKGEA